MRTIEKNGIAVILMACTLSIAVVSCQKATSKPASVQQGSQATVNAARNSATYRIYYDNGGNDYGCKDSGGNCLPDVIVTPNLISDLITTVDGGSAVEITAYFSNNRTALLHYIDSFLVDGVIHGDYTVSMHGTLQNGVGTRIMIWTNASRQTENVQPYIWR